MTTHRATKTMYCSMHSYFPTISSPLRSFISPLPATFLPLPNHPSAFYQLTPSQRRNHPSLGLDLRRQPDSPRHGAPHSLLPLLRLQPPHLLHLLRPHGTHRRRYRDQQEAQVPLRTGLRRRGPGRQQHGPQAQERRARARPRAQPAAEHQPAQRRRGDLRAREDGFLPRTLEGGVGGESVGLGAEEKAPRPRPGKRSDGDWNWGAGRRSRRSREEAAHSVRQPVQDDARLRARAGAREQGAGVLLRKPRAQGCEGAGAGSVLPAAGVFGGCGGQSGGARWEEGKERCWGWRGFRGSGGRGRKTGGGPGASGAEWRRGDHGVLMQ